MRGEENRGRECESEDNDKEPIEGVVNREVADKADEEGDCECAEDYDVVEVCDDAEVARLVPFADAGKVDACANEFAFGYAEEVGDFGDKFKVGATFVGLPFAYRAFADEEFVGKLALGEADFLAARCHELAEGLFFRFVHAIL